MAKSPSKLLLAISPITQKIYILRKTRVMLDSDLALLYGVTTKNLNRAVKRNQNRFPSDFLFRLTAKEILNLRCQSGTSSLKIHGGRRYSPNAFTEHGVAMLSSVLSSSRAVQVNIAIMRAFLQIRSMLSTHEDLRRKYWKWKSKFQAVFATLRQMLETPLPRKRQIGFHSRTDINAQAN